MRYTAHCSPLNPAGLAHARERGRRNARRTASARPRGLRPAGASVPRPPGPAQDPASAQRRSCSLAPCGKNGQGRGGILAREAHQETLSIRRVVGRSYARNIRELGPAFSPRFGHASVVDFHWNLVAHHCNLVDLGSPDRHRLGLLYFAAVGLAMEVLGVGNVYGAGGPARGALW